MSADGFIGPELDLDVGVHTVLLVSVVPGRISGRHAAGWTESGNKLLEVLELVDAVGVVRIRCREAQRYAQAEGGDAIGVGHAGALDRQSVQKEADLGDITVEPGEPVAGAKARRSVARRRAMYRGPKRREDNSCGSGWPARSIPLLFPARPDRTG